MIIIEYFTPVLIFSSPDYMEKLMELTDSFAQNYLTEKDAEILKTDISNFPKLVPIFRMPEFAIDPTLLREMASDFNLHMKKVRELTQPSIEVKGNWIHLKNIPEEVIPDLDEELSYDFPDKEHIKSVEQGLWDGRKRLLKKYEDHYRCRKGLLQRVSLFLKGKDIQYIFQQTFDAVFQPKLLLKYCGPTLWEHQEEAFTVCRTKKSGIVSIATGGGKTVLMTRLAHYFSASTNIFINSVDVGRQLQSVFVKCFGFENVGFIGDSTCEIVPKKVNIILLPTAFLALWSLGEIKRWKIKITPEGKKEYKLKKCTVSTKFYQSIVDTILDAKMSLYDECDNLGAETYSAVSACTTSQFNFGFSATPYRNDGKDMEIEAGVGRIIYSISVSDLIDRDILVLPEIHIYPVPRSVELKGRLPYPSIFKSCIKENSLRNLMITIIAKRFVNQGLTGIIIINRIDQGREINRRLKHEEINSKFVYGKDSSLTRTKVVNMLKKREISVIVTTLFGRGTDIPELQFGIRAKAEGATKTGKPNSDIIQTLGRVLRKDPNNPNKTKAYWVDFIDPYPYLREHSQARIEAYKSERNFEVKFREFIQE